MDKLNGILSGVKVLDFSTLLPGPLATLFLAETGAEVKVPLFINQGDTVKIDTSNGNYLERVKD